LRELITPNISRFLGFFNFSSLFSIKIKEFSEKKLKFWSRTNEKNLKSRQKLFPLITHYNNINIYLSISFWNVLIFLDPYFFLNLFSYLTIFSWNRAFTGKLFIFLYFVYLKLLSVVSPMQPIWSAFTA